jgi:hypothetical protein
LGEELVKLPASRIEGALLFLRIDAIEQRSALIIDPVIENLLDVFPSQRRLSFSSRMIAPPNVHRLSTCF